MKRILGWWTDGFVLWVVLFAVVAYFVPGVFTPFKPYIETGLGVIMFGMGITLLPEDFLRVIRMPRAVACGVVAQYLIMPLAAYTLAKLFRLSPQLSMGVIIVGSCPGGTASNVISYLAKADVALSVTLTACSTVLAVVLTPLLIQTLGGQFLPVNGWEIFLSVLKVVFVPVAAGIIVRVWLKDRARPALEFFPALSVLFIVLIVACVTALSRAHLAAALGIVGVTVILHNTLGLVLGYAFATAFRLPVSARRTIAIEVGMQNSGLGVALATQHFHNALVALPSTVFSVVHNVTGPLVAGYWRRSADREPARPLP